jgi:hypothetical protein
VIQFNKGWEMADDKSEININTQANVVKTTKTTTTSSESTGGSGNISGAKNKQKTPSTGGTSAQPISEPLGSTKTPGGPSSGGQQEQEPETQEEQTKDQGAQQQEKKPEDQQKPEDKLDEDKLKEDTDKKPSEEEAKKPTEEGKQGEQPTKTGEESKPGQNTGTQKPGRTITPSETDANLQNPAKGMTPNPLASKAYKREQFRNNAKNEAGKQVKKEATQIGKKALQAVMQAVKKIAAQIASYVAGLITAYGGWIIVLLVIILIIVLILFGSACASYQSGHGGTSDPQLAKSGSDEVKNIIKDSETPAKGVDGSSNAADFHLFDFLSASDKQYVLDGKIDRRILLALDYLVQKHNRIGVSYFITAYKDMPVDIESDSDSQLAENVSLHQRGMAADIAQIDFVYKALEPSKVCTAALTGTQLNDIVYYSDGMPTTDPATIGEKSTPTNLTSTKENLQQTTDAINKINTNNNQEINNKLNSIKNNINQISANLDKNSGQLSSLQTNVTNVNNNIEQIKTTINQSDIPQDQKDALIQKVGNLTQQLSTLTYRFNQLDTLATKEQELIDNINTEILQNTAALNGDITAINGEIDKINSNIDQLNKIQDIAVIKDIDTINTDLNKIAGEYTNLGSLGGSLDGLTSVVGANNELLRLYCFGGETATTLPSKEAIPIKALWQDDKPNIAHVSADKDDCTTHETVAGPLVCYTVFRPQAQIKVHQVITELLQFPYDMQDEQEYRVNQLVTFSQERDVDPFSDILDKLYGNPRPGNVGLFSMPESWAQVHIGF